MAHSLAFLSAFILATLVLCVSARLEISDGCLQETGLQKDAVEEFFKQYPVNTGDNNLKCFVRCEMLRQKLMNPNGDISAAQSTSIPPGMGPIINECAGAVSGTDLCERAYSFHKCVMDKKHEMHHH